MLKIILAKIYWVVTKNPSYLAVALTLFLKADTVDKAVYKVERVNSPNFALPVKKTFFILRYIMY